MKTVVGLFENYMDADRAVSDLTAHGFGRNEISVAARDSAIRDRMVRGTTGDPRRRPRHRGWHAGDSTRHDGGRRRDRRGGGWPARRARRPGYPARGR